MTWEGPGGQSDLAKTPEHCDPVGSSHVGSKFPPAPHPASVPSSLPHSPLCSLASRQPCLHGNWRRPASLPPPGRAWELSGWDASSSRGSPGIPTLAPRCARISEGERQAPRTLSGLLLSHCCLGYTAPPGSSPLPTHASGNLRAGQPLGHLPQLSSSLSPAADPANVQLFDLSQNFSESSSGLLPLSPSITYGTREATE